MKQELPESSYLESSHKIEGPMKDAKQSFYELAKNRIKYLTDDEASEWYRKVSGLKNLSPVAAYVYDVGMSPTEEGDIEKWINNLEIIVNMESFEFDGKDFSDIIPFVIEHEMYEAWLSVKKGAASNLDVNKVHLLTRRRDFLLAEQKGLGDRLYEYLVTINPDIEEECKYALQYAKKRLKK